MGGWKGLNFFSDRRMMDWHMRIGEGWMGLKKKIGWKDDGLRLVRDRQGGRTSDEDP